MFQATRDYIATYHHTIIKKSHVSQQYVAIKLRVWKLAQNEKIQKYAISIIPEIHVILMIADSSSLGLQWRELNMFENVTAYN